MALNEALELAERVPTSKGCPRCGVRKPHSSFYRTRHTADGLLSCCKECHRVDVARRRAKNLRASRRSVVLRNRRYRARKRLNAQRPVLVRRELFTTVIHQMVDDNLFPFEGSVNELGNTLLLIALTNQVGHFRVADRIAKAKEIAHRYRGQTS